MFNDDEVSLYIAQLHAIRARDRSTVYLDYQHLWAREKGALASVVTKQYYHFNPIKGLKRVIKRHVPELLREASAVPGVETGD